ncbi:MAG: hypothetical protein Ct9H90mP22_8580 [Gammaproteobacteria bacterium]|nr:MAG: hypothetical protein Ct9H90mP22_8580 [Gammaproteobacteria bacterium]
MELSMRWAKRCKERINLNQHYLELFREDVQRFKKESLNKLIKI